MREDNYRFGSMMKGAGFCLKVRNGGVGCLMMVESAVVVVLEI